MRETSRILDVAQAISAIEFKMGLVLGKDGDWMIAPDRAALVTELNAAIAPVKARWADRYVSKAYERFRGIVVATDESGG